ncbi:hypothetical protein QMK50_23905 [Pseudomonas sp. P5_152]|uniref:hypothetical protein n=1 Tax=Pseudomonas sp. P5_152 TaxID=3043442 RepID=UPI002A366DE5|nr:hypothetical protein [Pseudomonas sp. P5_152]MDX9667998.1 hypothetical protein [Pseudomonas sp. P5_152]
MQINAVAPNIKLKVAEVSQISVGAELSSVSVVISKIPTMLCQLFKAKSPIVCTSMLCL